MNETLRPPRNIELRHAESPADVAACFPVMRELRPQLASAPEFAERVTRQQTAGYRLLAAWNNDKPIGLAGYRVQENLIRGAFIYVDDLVVSADRRSDRIGARLLDAVACAFRRWFSTPRSTTASATASISVTACWREASTSPWP